MRNTNNSIENDIDHDIKYWNGLLFFFLETHRTAIDLQLKKKKLKCFVISCKDSQKRNRCSHILFFLRSRSLSLSLSISSDLRLTIQTISCDKVNSQAKAVLAFLQRLTNIQLWIKVRLSRAKQNKKQAIFRARTSQLPNKRFCDAGRCFPSVSILKMKTLHRNMFIFGIHIAVLLVLGEAFLLQQCGLFIFPNRTLWNILLDFRFEAIDFYLTQYTHNRCVFFFFARSAILTRHIALSLDEQMLTEKNVEIVLFLGSAKKIFGNKRTTKSDLINR